MNLPTISIIIPTLNSARTLASCLDSILIQDYPRDRLEIIIADGGSMDGTLEIISSKLSIINYQLLSNPLKTGEAGKAVGVKQAKNEIIALIDSDNILPQSDWLKLMVEPFQDNEIIASEPLYYTYRPTDGYITRYCALLGMNDPLCLFLRNYDRYNILTKKWAEVPRKEFDKGNYLKIEFDTRYLPTMGANGFFIRRSALAPSVKGQYLFDIDILYSVLGTETRLVSSSYYKFAKVKTGIIHIFSSDVAGFFQKQKRRMWDFLYFSKKGLRKYPWSAASKIRILKFMYYCVSIFPLITQAGRGFIRKPDTAWFFHPIACWITLFTYGGVYIKNYGMASGSRRQEPASRKVPHICVLHRYPISQAVGTNPSFMLFLKKLLAKDYKVTFISFKESNKNSEIEGINYIELDREISRANFFNKLMDSILFLFKTPFIVKGINKKDNIDLVYCDDSFPFYGFLIKKVTRLPTVIRLGDLQSAYMFAKGSIVKRSIFRLIFLFERKMWKQVDMVIPISNAFKEFLINNRIPENKMEVVPESIDLEGFIKNTGTLYIKNKYCINKDVLIMFHGLISPIKGIDILLKAAQKIIRSIPNAKFMIVGDGGDLNKLKKLSQGLGMEEHVIFTGWVPLNQIPDYINACDIGIPSRNTNLGNNFVVTTALLQYWAMKKPVVLPRLQAMAEIVKGTGLEEFLFEPDNPDDIFEKMKLLLTKPLSKRNFLGEEGNRLAYKYFNIESVSQKMVEVLDGFIIGSRRL